MADHGNGAQHQPLHMHRHEHAQPIIVSNNFRCRHIEAISLRNLLFPTAGGGESANEDLNGADQHLSQILSDEETLSPQSEDGDPAFTLAAGPDLSGTSPPRNAHDASLDLAKRRGVGRDGHNHAARKIRPQAKRQISRSMSGAFAEAQQQALEDRIHSRRLDSFFSLHALDSTHAVLDEPVYVSEACDNFMNPDFKPLTPADIQDSDFLRGRTLAIRVWARHAGDKSYSMLIEERIALPELSFVTEDIEFSEVHFRDNTVLLHMPDGMYVAYTGSAFEEHPTRAPSKAPETKSASFDALMRLKKLVEVIDDAAATQQAIKAQIEDILADQGGHQLLSRSSNAIFALQNVRDAAARVDRDISRLSHDREVRRKRQADRKAAFEAARTELKDSAAAIPTINSDTKHTQLEHFTLKSSLKSHTARVAEDLLYIFPIEPLANPPVSAVSTPVSSRPSSPSSQRRQTLPGLAFSIRGLYVPHASVLAQQSQPPRHEAEVSAGLGYVGTIVMLLSRILLLHIPFPIHVVGSHSVIRDDITPDGDLISNRLLLPSQVNLRVDEVGNASQDDPDRRTGWEVDGARTFPLYARNADPARFRWAVYLLNKDIEELVSKNGLRVVDVRDTLANLRLLLVALAGGDKDSNLPKREAGRIAGLHAQRE